MKRDSGMQEWINKAKINIVYHINRIKGKKNHVIISIDVKKALDKFQHSFVIFQNTQ